MEIDAEIEKLFSKKFPVKYFEKLTKVENGNMSFSLYEIMIQGKPVDGKIKTDKTIAYPEISSIILLSDGKIVFDLNEKNSQLTVTVDDPLYVIKCIFIAFKLFFPFEDVFSFVAVKNDSSLSLDTMKQEVKDLYIHTPSPCNNFSFGIKFFAKYKYLPENEEIIWDIDTVYANRSTNLFTLKDFDHLKPKYLFPVLGAMCYNTYFTELSLSYVDLTPYEKLLERVLKCNKKFKKLYFDSCNLKLSLCTSIANGLEGQKGLKHLDLSNNEGIGDKGVEIFSIYLKKSSRILEVLKMSKCNLTSISVCKIADAFTHNIKANEDSLIELRVLDLSNNMLKDNFRDIFYDFLSKCSHLEDLNLSNMNCSIELIAGSLILGPVKTLKYLDLSENLSPMSSQSCTQWSTFFKEAKSLMRINLSNFKSLHCSITDGLMLGIEDNAILSLTGIEIVISNSNFNSENFSKFSDFIYKAKAVTCLDISSNGIGIEFQTLLNKLPEFPSLKSLNVSNNFGTLKPKEQQSILAHLTTVLQLESVNLQELYMANCNFGGHLSTFVSELDSLFSLRVLDISGNNIGNIVARTIGRVLTIDKHIKELSIDNNNISKEIYEEILNDLSGNYTLCVFHVPFMDMVKYPPRLVIPIIEKINKHHKKVNKIYQGVSFEDIKAMAFSCIMNQTSENIDKCKVTLQESCNRLKGINTNNVELKTQISKCLSDSLENVKSIDASKDLVMKLNSIYKSNDNELLLTDLRIKKVIETITSDVQRLLNEYMGQVVDEMMKEMKGSLPYLLSDNEILKQELIETCQKVMNIPKEYLSKLFSRFIEKNLLKKVYETQSNITNALCDSVTDQIITQMNACDIQANRLITASKNSAGEDTLSDTSPEKLPEKDQSPDINEVEMPVIRQSDEKKGERDKMMSVRTSRLSHLAASKARPLSKALKPMLLNMDSNSPPPKPMKPTRLKPVTIKPTNINFSYAPDEPITPESNSFKSLTPDSDSMKPIVPSRGKRLLPVSESSATDSTQLKPSISVPASTIVVKDIKLTIPKPSADVVGMEELVNESPNIAGLMKNQGSGHRRELKFSPGKTMNESISSRESIQDTNDIISNLKGRPKHVKSIKPRVISPAINSEENTPSMEDKLQHFHNFGDPEVEIVTKATTKKKTFFKLSKSKSTKPKAIDLNNLGREGLSSSDSEIEEKSSLKGFKKNNSMAGSGRKLNRK